MAAQDYKDGVAFRGWDPPVVDPAGAGSAPVVEREPIDFRILQIRTQRLHVVEAPPMPGLPPVEGTINFTMQVAADPGLVDPPAQISPTLPIDSEYLAGIRQQRQNFRGSQLLLVSATVYDRSRTLLQIYPSGKVKQRVTAWSNVDFNHFSGFSTFRVTQDDGSFMDFSLIMSLGNAYAEGRKRHFAREPENYAALKVPEIEDIAVVGPRYVVIEGHDSGSAALDIVAYAHKLYAKEGGRMEAAYHERVRKWMEREAYFRANPPVPKDVTIRFWKRAGPAPAAIEQLERSVRQ